MGGGVDAYICIVCLRQGFGIRKNKVIKCDAYGVAIMNGRVGGFGALVLFGLQKLITDLDMRNGHKGGVRVGFIYIKDMYNNDVGKGGAYAYEAYEAK